MTAATQDLLATLTRRLESVADGAMAPAVPAADVPDDDPRMRALAAAVERLEANVAALQALSCALADGRLDHQAPPRLRLLDPLKALQASLRHLTWQTREVADGHLEHRVDFLGEFSDAFNRMIESLRTKQRAETEAMHASRQAGVGHLAAGLAHEINSPIQYMADNLRYLETALAALESVRRAASGAPDAPPLADALAEADLAAADADVTAALAETLAGAVAIGDTVQAMREFSQAGDADSGRVDLNRAITNALTVSRHAWQGHAGVELRLAPELPPVAGNCADVGQVVLQLVLNAAQALAGNGGTGPGRIVITTGGESGAVRLEIADNGPGIPPELRERVFELFWTSHPNAEGRGLGLALCRDIVTNRLGGRIAIGGEPGTGTVVTVTLRPIA